jgi:hypothetical protein
MTKALKHAMTLAKRADSVKVGLRTGKQWWMHEAGKAENLNFGAGDTEPRNVAYRALDRYANVLVGQKIDWSGTDW